MDKSHPSAFSRPESDSTHIDIASASIRVDPSRFPLVSSHLHRHVSEPPFVISSRSPRVPSPSNPPILFGIGPSPLAALPPPTSFDDSDRRYDPTAIASGFNSPRLANNQFASRWGTSSFSPSVYASPDTFGAPMPNPIEIVLYEPSGEHLVLFNRLTNSLHVFRQVGPLPGQSFPMSRPTPASPSPPGADKRRAKSVPRKRAAAKASPSSSSSPRSQATTTAPPSDRPEERRSKHRTRKNRRHHSQFTVTPMDVDSPAQPHRIRHTGIVQEVEGTEEELSDDESAPPSRQRHHEAFSHDGRCPYCHQTLPNSHDSTQYQPEMHPEYFRLLEHLHNVVRNKTILAARPESPSTMIVARKASGNPPRAVSTPPHRPVPGRPALLPSEPSLSDSPMPPASSSPRAETGRVSRGTPRNGTPRAGDISQSPVRNQSSSSTEPEPLSASARSDHRDQEDDHLSAMAYNNGYYRRFFHEERKIGHGTFGGVYLTHHCLDSVNLGTYAIKKVPVGDSRPWLLNVLKEVRALEALRHPNIVGYKHTWLEMFRPSEFGPEVPCLFILMEYANRGSLADYIWPQSKKDENKQADEVTSSQKRRAAVERARAALKATQQEVLSAANIAVNPSSDSSRAFVTSTPLPVPSASPPRQSPSRSPGEISTDSLPHVNTSELKSGSLPPFLPDEEVWGFFIDTCLGLRHLHRAGIIHRDLKPENLLLTLDRTDQSPRVLISDFGQSRIIGVPSVPTGNTGTLAYCAPECLLNNSPDSYDEKCDIWSLGVVLYAMAFGTLPYESDTCESMFALIHSKMLSFPAYPPRSRAMKQLIADMLRIIPSERISLDEILAHQTLLSQDPSQRIGTDYHSRQRRSAGKTTAASTSVPITVPPLSQTHSMQSAMAGHSSSSISPRLPTGFGAFTDSLSSVAAAQNLSPPTMLGSTPRLGISKTPLLLPPPSESSSGRDPSPIFPSVVSAYGVASSIDSLSSDPLSLPQAASFSDEDSSSLTDGIASLTPHSRKSFDGAALPPLSAAGPFAPPIQLTDGSVLTPTAKRSGPLDAEETLLKRSKGPGLPVVPKS